MGKIFDNTFSEVQKFEPYGYYISRNVFKTKEEASEVFSEYMNDLGDDDQMIKVQAEEVKEAYVRYQPTPWGLRDEIGDMAWITCDKDARRAQPCWVYGD